MLAVLIRVTTGFRPVFHGDALEYSVTKLARNTQYKFRIVAENAEVRLFTIQLFSLTVEQGKSMPSNVVAYSTQGTPPNAPTKPALAGKVAAQSTLISSLTCFI